MAPYLFVLAIGILGYMFDSLSYKLEELQFLNGFFFRYHSFTNDTTFYTVSS